jgi:hypothetical protein
LLQTLLLLLILAIDLRRKSSNSIFNCIVCVLVRNLIASIL